MICPNCGNEIAPKLNRCPACGTDVRVRREILNRSAGFYNIGLAKAQARDLGGAVMALRESIRYNKYNTEARNLLGLVLLESGEVADALAQWVISQNLQPEENLASAYLKDLQSNQSYLHELNTQIRKYNQALDAIRSGNKDLAIVQLRKVYGSNAKFLRAGELLTLLYLENEEYDRARKTIRKILKVDRSNTMALRCREEIHQLEDADEIPRESRQEFRAMAAEGLENVEKAGHYKEEKQSAFLWINLVIGLGVGLLAAMLLIFPTYKKKVIQENGQAVSELSQKVAAFDSDQAEVLLERDNLEAQVATLQVQLAQYQQDQSDTANAAESLESLLQAIKLYVEGEDNETVVRTLLNVNINLVDNETAKSMYNTLLRRTRNSVVNSWMKQGIEEEYNQGAFKTALATFQKVLELDPENTKAIFYVGRAYHRLGEKELAAEYYQKIINEYPDCSEVEAAKRRLDEIGN
ncbi:MAG: tetratricopeptide repeat protein [Lachnospiraceae bacterium]|nr:tetratricopeptide repeat protein [Lachnospiraceae bacterium]